MKTIIETIKENKYFIIITILSILTTLFFATTALFISISDDLTHVVQTKDEEINKLNAEIDRQKMISDDWYQMWIEERSANEWLWDMYYSNVSSYDGEYEYYE